ncbi:MAG: hypothetical protein CL565_07065 [Alphaproteobacteria bacterium]|nr:hypothetical protein [Alphaproteobacteria bacterium]|tara:strand:- start:377 stop:1003 length:627 start_codon:yes stop_codon:yes gene_type:complete
MFRLILTALILVAVPATANAEAQDYEFDKKHTMIMFNVGHMGMSHSWGKFLDFDGDIKFDEESPESSSVDMTIQTASINMDDEKWEDHLKNQDFFDVKEYPTMTFKSTGIQTTGGNTGKLTGDLTLLGVTKPITLDVTFNKAGKRPMGNAYAAGFSAKGEVTRSEFGMDYGIPMVDDKVNLIIEVEIEREGPSPESTDESGESEDDSE